MLEIVTFNGQDRSGLNTITINAPPVVPTPPIFPPTNPPTFPEIREIVIRHLPPNDYIFEWNEVVGVEVSLNFC